MGRRPAKHGRCPVPPLPSAERRRSPAARHGRLEICVPHSGGAQHCDWSAQLAVCGRSIFPATGSLLLSRGRRHWRQGSTHGQVAVARRPVRYSHPHLCPHHCAGRPSAIGRKQFSPLPASAACAGLLHVPACCLPLSASASLPLPQQQAGPGRLAASREGCGARRLSSNRLLPLLRRASWAQCPTRPWSSSPSTCSCWA